MPLSLKLSSNFLKQKSLVSVPSLHIIGTFIRKLIKSSLIVKYLPAPLDREFYEK
jgi:hypothetical protein